jgi:hypothetical protein
MKFILAILLILTNLAFAGKGEDLAKFGAQSVVINGKNYLSLNLENEPHWHTYWKNPGTPELLLRPSLFLMAKR